MDSPNLADLLTTDEQPKVDSRPNAGGLTMGGRSRVDHQRSRLQLSEQSVAVADSNNRHHKANALRSRRSNNRRLNVMHGRYNDRKVSV